MKALVINGFVWLPITDKAKDVYKSGLFETYALHDDNTESLIESDEQLNEALEKGLTIAIEVGDAI